MALDEPMYGLEHRIMTDIVRRIRENGEITAAADWQITRLIQLGMAMEEITAAINEALGAAEGITDNLFSNIIEAGYARDNNLYKAIGKVQIPFNENAPLQQMISAVTAQTNETMHNITQSLGFAQRGADGRISFTPIADYYQKTLDNAMLDISSGAFDYNTVLNRTVKEMTNSGLRTVDYATGWSNRVPVAARRAVMTGMNQLTAKKNEQDAEELHTNWFEISWHSGARPSHWWGGRQYTKEQLTTICNLGDVTGLCGANCYHNYHPFIPGISIPVYTEEELEELNRQEKEPIEWNGKKYTKYEATQRQRQLETTMRAQREEMALLEEGGADEDDLINCRARYHGTSHEYAQFSKAMGLPQERERVYADGLGTKLMQGKTEGGSGKDSPVKVPAVGAHVVDTVTPEERKELLSRDKVDIADNAKTTKTVEKASVVELWETENYKNSTEKGLLILPDGTTKDFGGIEHHVTGKEEDIKLMDGATFTHNHPTDNTFSQNDIVTGLVKGNLKEMRAVTSTGDVHILVNNGATEQQRKKFNVDYQQRRMKAANTADAIIRRGEKINKDEYVKSRLETFMAEHAEEYNLSYSKTRIDVNKQSIDKSAKNGIIEEREELPRKIKSGSNTVDWSIVQSEEYSKKYTKLSDDERVSSAIETRAKWALNNRDGKNTEELYAISLKDGREVSRITDQNYDSAVKRTSKFTRELNAADESGEEILLLHNHPRGLPPSISDINALLKNKNVSGITVGHNGSIYRYTRPNKEIPLDEWNVAMKHFKEFSETTAMEKSLEILSRKFEFIFEKI
ncbi:MAG: phage minor capsid protein [Ruminococcus sp.]|nr:phage minor capsid protein [Ruminococcus sp.]